MITKVKDLIEQLKELPEDAEVWIGDWNIIYENFAICEVYKSRHEDGVCFTYYDKEDFNDEPHLDIENYKKVYSIIAFK